MLKNKLWKDRKTTVKTLLITCIVILAQIGLTVLFYRTIFKNIIPVEGQSRGILSLFFLIAVIWIYLIACVQGISNFVKSFFKSPDMNYLISIPIPSNYIFLFKFYEYIVVNAKSMLFLFFPFLAAIGVSINASLFYYILIIPLYFLLSIIPASIGVMVAMTGVRLISAKTFTVITSALSFVANIFFILLFSRVENIPTDFFTGIMDFLQKPLVSDIIPITGGMRLFNAAAFNENGWAALLFLLLFSFLLVYGAFILSKHLFFEGWAKNQHIEPEIRKKKNFTLKKRLKTGGITFEWIKTEWKMAIRNQEMLMGCVFMLLFFVISAFLFSYQRYFPQTPLIGIFILITIAAIFNIIAVSIPFIPMEITKDKRLWKERYWTLKSMPLKGSEIFFIQCMMFFVPGYLISLAGILSYSLMNGVDFFTSLWSAGVLFVILYGSSAIYVSGELLSLTDFFERNEFLGNLMTLIIPAVYGLFSAGIITLFLSRDVFKDIPIISALSNILTLPVTLIISITVIASALLLTKRLFIYAWEQLDI